MIKIIINLLAQIDQRKKNTHIPQKLNFTGKLEENSVATMFFISEKQQETVLNFSFDLLILTE